MSAERPVPNQTERKENPFIGKKVLIIEDHKETRENWALAIRDEGAEVIEASKVQEYLEILKKEKPQVILLDLVLPDGDGRQVLEQTVTEHPEIKVIVVTGHDTAEVVARVMEMGAYDYISKPSSLSNLLEKVGEALREYPSIASNVIEYRNKLKSLEPSIMVGRSRAMERMYMEAGWAARRGAPMLIWGETGAGKERLAMLIHSISWRGEQNQEDPFANFYTEDCGKEDEETLNDALFGHLPYSFTDAKTERTGTVELASQKRGTIFLDEIGKASEAIQRKVLRLIANKKFKPLGASEEREADVLIIAATNRNPKEDMEEGRLLPDLYFRLTGVPPIYVPPLRYRRDDIPLLTARFLNRLEEEFPNIQISKEALDLLLRHDWPGNVRELENLIGSAAVRARGQVIREEDIVLTEWRPDYIGRPLREVIRWAEIKEIQRALKEAGGDLKLAAQRLQAKPESIQKKIKRYSIEI